MDYGVLECGDGPNRLRQRWHKLPACGCAEQGLEAYATFPSLSPDCSGWDRGAGLLD